MEALSQGKPEIKVEQTVISPLTSLTVHEMSYHVFNAYGGLNVNVPAGVKLIVTHVGNGGIAKLTKGQTVSQPIGSTGNYAGTRTASWNTDGTFTLTDSRLASYRSGSAVYCMLG